MIKQVTAYGIMLTTEFGQAKKEYHSLVALIYQHFYQKSKEYYYDNSEDYNSDNDDNYVELLDDCPWLCICPSSGRDQLVLGFEIEINKYTQFNALDEKWINLIKTLPEQILNIVHSLGLNEPNVVQMSGKY